MGEKSHFLLPVFHLPSPPFLPIIHLFHYPSPYFSPTPSLTSLSFSTPISLHLTHPLLLPQTRFLSRNYTAESIEAVKELDDVLAQLAVSAKLEGLHQSLNFSDSVVSFTVHSSSLTDLGMSLA